MEKINAGEELTLEIHSWSYEESCSQTLYLIPACDLYAEKENGVFEARGTDAATIASLLADAIELTIVGIIRPAEDAENASLTEAIGYTSALTEYLIDYTLNSAVVTAQMENPGVNVLTGTEFAPADEDDMVAAAKAYVDYMTTSVKA